MCSSDLRRERTNTPLQALVLLNDPQLVEAARRLAENALAASPETDRRLGHLAVRLLSRALSGEERAIAREVLEQLLERYRSRPGEAKALIATGASTPDPALPPEELAAWTLVASQLLCLDATLNFSYNIVKDPVHVRDFTATLLHLFGFDHQRFTYKFQGLDQRLSGVEPARVVREILA